jgi:phosphoribosylanthranilate isomerase
MVRVKICGINEPRVLTAAIEAGVDWLGLVFFPPSPRFVPPGYAAELAALAAGGPPLVGLFVDPTEEQIAATLARVRLDALQVYGAGTDIARLKLRFGLPVWRGVGIETEADLPTEAGEADGLVLEARPEATATRPGGNAMRFDWSLLAGWRAPTSWLLAGGLSPANVAEAVRVTRAAAVDVSSGVERRPGVKDPGLIREFVAEAKAGHFDSRYP